MNEAFVNTSRNASREKLDRCHSCGAPIFWAHTQEGKRIPMNPDPDPKGNITIHNDVVILHNREIRPPVALYVGRPFKGVLFDEYVGRRYKTHFATCKQGREWRGKSRS
jgi:hypothetical protein